MKFYKIKLPHVHRLGYQYPPNYENTIGIFNQAHIYFTDETDGIFTLLIAIPDANALSSLPENVTEITEAEAFVISEKYNPSVEIITNEAVVKRLEIKTRIGDTLTQKEMKALDPNDEEPGFGFSENFEKIIKKKNK